MTTTTMCCGTIQRAWHLILGSVSTMGVDMRAYLAVPWALLVSCGLPGAADAGGISHQELVSVVRKGKAVDIKQAMTAIEEERATAIADLRAMYTVARASKEQSHRIGPLLRALGAIRAIEALDIIVGSIGYSDYVPKLSDLDDLPPPVPDMYPAASALLKIGPVTVDYLLRAVAKGGLSKREMRTVGWVVVTLLGHTEGERRIVAFSSTVEEKAMKDRLLSKELLGYYD